MSSASVRNPPLRNDLLRISCLARAGAAWHSVFCVAPSGKRLTSLASRRTVWTAILLASFGWGTGGPATRGAFREGVEPFELVLFRVAIAALAVGGFILMRSGRLPRGRHVWRLGVVMSVTNLVAPFSLFTLAYDHASAGFVGLIAALIPLATALLAHFLLPDEPMQAAKSVGLGVAFVGVAVLGFSGDSGLESGGRPGVALALGIAAVALISLASIYAKHHAGTYDPVELTGVQFIIGTPMAVIVALAIEGAPAGITGRGWWLLIFLALVSTVLPYATYYWVLRHTRATHAAVIGYLVPIVAIAGGIIFLAEQLQPGILVGGTLIIIGVLLTERFERRLAPTRLR